MFQYPYERFVAEKMALIAKKPFVLDVGGGEPFTKWMWSFKELFVGVEYKTLDYDAHAGADIVGDIHAIPMPDGSVDAIICSSVLEHVRDPLRAMGELKRVLKPGGRILFYVPSIYPYHARKGAYPDLWRFFEDTMHVLFEGFTEIEIERRGGYFLALSYFIPLQHRMRGFLDKLAYVFDVMCRTERRTTTAGFYVYAEK